MKNHFFIGYAGNKRKEVKSIYDYIGLNNKPHIKTIIEPYCGTSALSYYIWLNNKEKNYKYILNDNNPFLIELYNIAKDDNKLKDLHKDIIKLYNSIFDLPETEQKQAYNKIDINKDLISWYLKSKIYSIRAGLFPIRKFKIEVLNTLITAPIIDFIRNADITFTNNNGLDTYKLYCNDENTLIFLDPPYLSRENSFYKTPTAEIYEYLFNNDIEKNKAYIVLCLENSWIIKMLFKGKKNIMYDKYYEQSHTKTEHIIIVNK
jgi:site-specific DNA-adenine methylase